MSLSTLLVEREKAVQMDAIIVLSGSYVHQSMGGITVTIKCGTK
jgi:hypothetical protein